MREFVCVLCFSKGRVKDRVVDQTTKKKNTEIIYYFLSSFERERERQRGKREREGQRKKGE